MPSLLGLWGSIWSGVHWLMKLHSWWVWDWAFCIGLLRCSWHVPFYRNHLSVPRRRSCAAFSSASEVAKLWLWRWINCGQIQDLGHSRPIPSTWQALNSDEFRWRWAPLVVAKRLNRSSTINMSELRPPEVPEIVASPGPLHVWINDHLFISWSLISYCNHIQYGYVGLHSDINIYIYYIIYISY
jgi:hypothetical protein